MWAWPQPPETALRFCLELPRETPSNNVIRGMHFRTYRELRKQWQMLVFVALNGRRPPKPLDSVFLHIERNSHGEGLDWDNAYGGLKPLLDCLVIPTRSNPDGLGVITDDGPQHMPYPPYFTQRQAPPKQGTTVLRIYDLTAFPQPTLESPNV